MVIFLWGFTTIEAVRLLQTAFEVQANRKNEKPKMSSFASYKSKLYSSTFTRSLPFQLPFKWDSHQQFLTRLQGKWRQAATLLWVVILSDIIYHGCLRCWYNGYKPQKNLPLHQEVTSPKAHE